MTKQETIEALHKMAENSVKKREALGIEGENKEFQILVYALKYLQD